MNILDRMRISTRLLVSSSLAGAGILLMGLFALVALHDSMMEDRRIKTQHVVELAHGVLSYYHAQQEQGQLDETTARSAALKAIQALRYGSGDYFWIQDTNLKMVMHPIKPELNGKDLASMSDPNGVKLFVEMDKVVKADGAGFVSYAWPKPGKDAPQPKVSYVKGFAPWGLIVGSGIYVDDVNTAFWRQAMASLVLLIIITVIMAVLSWRIGRGIVRQLGGEPAYAMEVAGRIATGDLSHPIDSAYPGSLLHAMNDMQTQLRQLFRRIKEMSDLLSAGADSLTQASSEITIASSRQAESTSTMAAGVEQMAVSISEVAEMAHQTEDNSEQVVTLADAGDGLVQETTQRLGVVVESVTNSSERIESLRLRSQEIGNIAGVIKDIADQTNLLALNAAIEAARAGEQGRGFAVVADEVRKLAERTTQATGEITHMVTSVQSDTQQAMEAMERSLPQVKAGLDAAQKVAESFRTISSQVHGSLAKVHDVAHATKEQSTAINEIAQHVERVATMAEETHATVQSNADSAHQLKGWSIELRDSVTRFKLA